MIINYLTKLAQFLLIAGSLSQNQIRCVQADLKLFSYPIESKIGIAACPVSTSEGIKDLSKLGYSVFTYKTIRSSYHPIKSSKLYFVDIPKQLNRFDFNTKFYLATNKDNLAITNAFGINSLDKESLINDISKAKGYLSNKQVLIVSIYGSGKTQDEQIRDFIAKIAIEGGAQIIEANLSCPNINSKDFLYKNPQLVYVFCKAITSEIKIPLIIKVGIFDNFEQTKSVILAACSAGARGICGINSVPMQIVDSQGMPVYGIDQKVSGVSGKPIFNLAIEFVKDIRKIIIEEKLDFALLACGGITQPEDFDILLQAGADVALTATSAIFNKNLKTKF